MRRPIFWPWLWSGFCLAVACGPSPRPAGPPSVPEPDAGPAAETSMLRDVITLVPGVRPLRQKVELTIDPARPEFTGQTEIELALDRPQPGIILHATGLAFDEVTIAVPGGKLTARVERLDNRTIRVAVDKPLPAGGMSMTLRFRGRLGGREDVGLYRHGDEGTMAAFSAFFPDGARHAFPCFDDPTLRIPWRLSLVVPGAEIALAGTPVTATAPEPGGKKRVTFAETRPLPPYLVALAVGPFELVTAGVAGKNGAALRFAIPRGRGAEIRYAIELVPKLIVALEDATQTPFPYGKLDVVIAPRDDGGETPGLLALPPDVLVRPDEESLARRQAIAGLLAHTLAHQWFGNLVTPIQFADPWPEAFASWVARIALHAAEPGWHIDLARVLEIGRADPLGRGAAILHLVEGWVGQEAFRGAVRAFFETHRDGIAEIRDVEPLGRGEIAGAALRLFATDVIPVVNAKIDCPAGTPPSVTIDRDGGSEPVPICVAYPRAAKAAAKDRARACGILTESTVEIALPEAKSCPTWVLANAGAEGIHRVVYPAGVFAALVKAAPGLEPAERLALALEAQALVRAGKLPLGDALALVPVLANDPIPEVVHATIPLLGNIRRDALAPAEVAALTKLARRLYGPRARTLGWQSRPGEPADATAVRPAVLYGAAVHGDDRELARGAEAPILTAIRRRTAVEPGLLQVALNVVGRGRSQTTFAALRDAAKAENDPRFRAELVASLGGFDHLNLANATLAYLLEVGPELAPRPLRALAMAPATRALAWDFLKQHAGDLLQRSSPENAAALLGLPAVVCDATRRAEAEALLAPHAGSIQDGERRLRQALGRAEACEAAVKRDAAGVTKFLRSAK